MNDDSDSQLLPILPVVESWRDSCMPATIESHGPAARFAWEEFFLGEIRNEYTRRNYLHAVRQFLSWTDARGVELTRIAPMHVGAYLDESTTSAPTKKLRLAAIRAFFDRLVLRHVVVLNPAQSVRGPKHATVEGRTPEIGPTQVRQLLGSITSCDVVASRDRALIATLIYTAARVGAVVRLRLRDLLRDEATWSIRFHEKGGKQREIPVREDLRRLLSDYLALAGAATWHRQNQIAKRQTAHTRRRLPDAQATTPARRTADATIPPFFPCRGDHRPPPTRRLARRRAEPRRPCGPSHDTAL